MNLPFNLQTKFQKSSRERGLTLLEITVVLALMMSLSSIVIFSISALNEWKKGRAAAESLKAVYLSQKSYLADHPSDNFADFEADDLIPYLPNRPGAMPSATGLEDESLTLNFNVMPPEFELTGSGYDPSNSTTDGLWDVGSL